MVLKRKKDLCAKIVSVILPDMVGATIEDAKINYFLH